MVVNVWCVDEESLYYFHDKREELSDEDVSALIVVTPQLEQVQQFLAHDTFLMIGSKKVK